MASADAKEFEGTDRYVVDERLGEGGMGVVYRAFDRERNTAVALKLLRKLSPDALYRFKREFRALADVSHPNLASLYELVSAGDDWFFTMELLDGVDFMHFIRGSESDDETTAATKSRADVPASQATVTALIASTPAQGQSASEPPSISNPPLRHAAQFERLRECLRQLAMGIEALHAAGHLHRDIKPSNVLVTTEGRVVVLDFGVTTPLAGDNQLEEPEIVLGTPAYMAPEQGTGVPLSEASDWYSVGVMTYEALTGRRPFVSRDWQVLLRTKREVDPVAPRRLARQIPRDLDQLCLALLSRNPAKRPRGREILRRLGASSDAALELAAVPGADVDTLLCGREQQLGQLRDAFAAASAGETRVVLVRGVSGVGKSALLGRFTDELRQSGAAVVLAGRCYELESVPYKALDSLVDELMQHLRAMPRREADALMPGGIRELARLFPVLRRVESVVAAADSGEVHDPLEMRRRALSAMRELVRRLAVRQPVVLHIEDIQWGDADSAALLIEVLRPPSPPPVLLLASLRVDASTHSSLIRLLSDSAIPLQEMLLERLDAQETLELARALLASFGADSERAGEIARESAGHPLFVHELARYVALRGASDESIGGEVTLERLLDWRLAALPRPARRLLDVVAVAGRPLPQGVAMRAADVDQGTETLELLRRGRLLRTAGARRQDPVETYHDRIRDAVTAMLHTEEQRAYHRQLAVVLEASGAADPETLAAHYDAAGDGGRAGQHYLAAAEIASRTLAFDRAAQLLERAIALLEPSGRRRGALYQQLGEARAFAGHSSEAAEAYLEAARSGDGATALRRRALAAEQLLRGGRVDEGIDVLSEVLGILGIPLPASRAGALWRILAGRAHIRLRGLQFRELPPGQITLEQETRLDMCWTASTALGVCDPLRGAVYQIRHLLESLKVGEPVHLARAFAVEAIFAAFDGVRARARIDEVVALAHQLAEHSGDPLTVGFVRGGEGFARYLLGDWEKARAGCEAGLEMYRRHGTGPVWERNFLELYTLWALFYRGDIAEVAGRVPGLLREAEARGDIYMATNLRNGVPALRWLVSDRPDHTRRDSEESMRHWSERDYHTEHGDYLFAQVHADLYEGDPATGYQRMCIDWPKLKRSFLLKIQLTRAENLFLRGRCAVAAAALGPGRARWLRRAHADARRLDRERVAYATAMAALLRAGVAAISGNDAAALEQGRRAAELSGAAGMELLERVALRAVGRLQDGDEGRAALARANSWLRQQGVVDCDRFAATFAPGL